MTHWPDDLGMREEEWEAEGGRVPLEPEAAVQCGPVCALRVLGGAVLAAIALFLVYAALIIGGVE